MTTSDTTLSQPGRQMLLPGVVSHAPKAFLRVEGLALLAASAWFYAGQGQGWLLYAALFLLPDVSMLGYLLNRRWGAMMYNVGHSTLAPLAVAGLGLHSAHPLLLSIGLVWLGHIGFDRFVGYGLKYDDAFRHTHLGAPFSWAARA
jgi:hypothetical protein